MGVQTLGLRCFFFATCRKAFGASIHFLRSQTLWGSIFRTKMWVQSLRGISFDAFCEGAELQREHLRCIFLGSRSLGGRALMHFEWSQSIQEAASVYFSRVRDLWESSFDAFLAGSDPRGEQLRCICCGRGASGEQLRFIFAVAEPPAE